MEAATTLLLRLEGMLQSYGSNSLGPVRETALEPSKAAVLGMALGAIGKDRDSDGQDGLPTLAEFAALKMGVVVDREGTILSDFQTVGSKMKDKSGEMLALPKGDGSHRPKGVGLCFTKHYLSEASFLVGLEGDRALLEMIADALKRPRWSPCLGRRGCFPSVPIRLPDGGIRNLPLEKALRGEPKIHGRKRFVIEVLPGEGTRRCNDVPLDFSSLTRRFGMREIKEWIED
jgi:CRISPR system Cascade subunit CasD